MVCSSPIIDAAQVGRLRLRGSTDRVLCLLAEEITITKTRVQEGRIRDGKQGKQLRAKCGKTSMVGWVENKHTLRDLRRCT
jgi:hypothetical protein